MTLPTARVLSLALHAVMSSHLLVHGANGVPTNTERVYAHLARKMMELWPDGGMDALNAVLEVATQQGFVLTSDLNPESLPYPVSGTCVYCGCTDDQACEPPCDWLDSDRVVCTAPCCLDQHAALRKAVAE